MKAPVVFVGHGSPLNGINNNHWTRNWRKLGEKLDGIKGVVMVSGHWYTYKTLITGDLSPKFKYEDGISKENLNYSMRNSESLKEKVYRLIGEEAEFDNTWGYDHASYTVLKHIFPKGDRPVLQVSLNSKKDLEYHYELGKKLKELRKENILIISSGNLVHNLFKLKNIKSFAWAEEFNSDFINLVKEDNIKGLMEIKNNKNFNLAAPSIEHILPIYVSLGGLDRGEEVQVFNNDIVAGSLSMTSFVWGLKEKLDNKF